MRCEKCDSELSFDGSCEECWLKNSNDRIDQDIKSTKEAIKIMEDNNEFIK